MKTVEPYMPIQYIMGKTEFFGLDLAVNEDVFIPRPETEVLVQAVIDILHEPRIMNHESRILDLCTGSGSIAIALMARLRSPSMLSKVAEGNPAEALTKNMPGCKIIASDISYRALNVARMNAHRNSVSEKIEFMESDLFANIKGKFNVIVSNPPYVARYEFETIQKEVLREPRMAIDGGEDGLDFYRKITERAPEFLKQGGYLVMEMGFGQKNAIKKIIEDSNVLKVTDIKKDGNAIDRVIIAKWIS